MRAVSGNRISSAMRSAPIWVGSTTLLAPAWISLGSVEGISPRAMISICGFRASRRQGDEDIGGVVGQHAGQGAGAGRCRHRAGTVRRWRRPPGTDGPGRAPRRRAFRSVPAPRIWRPPAFSSLASIAADAAEAHHDHMVFQLVDFRFHAPASQNLLQLGDGEKLDQGAGQKDHAGTAQDHQRHGHGMQIGRGDGVHLAIAHGVDRQQHHVAGVAEAPARAHEGQRSPAPRPPA